MADRQPIEKPWNDGLSPEMERLCRAAGAAIEFEGDELDDPRSVFMQVGARDLPNLVRAVLQALRDPSEGMVEAMEFPMMVWTAAATHNGSDWQDTERSDAVSSVFTAGIDHLLAEA